MELVQAIKKIVKPMIKNQSIKARVISVDKTNDVCDVEPLNNGAKYLGVKLKAISDTTESKVIAYPKVDSDVIISIIDNNDNDTFVSQISEVESYLIENKECSVLIKQDGSVNINSENIIINNGSLGGLIKVNELKTQIEKNTQAINAIQEAFKTWVVASGDGGAVLKAASSTFTFLPLANLNSIENQKVKHG